MSFSKQTTIRCDFCVAWEMMSGTVAYVRKILRRMGWNYVSGKDICPACKTATSSSRR